MKVNYMFFIYVVSQVLFPLNYQSQVNAYFQNNPEWRQTSNCSNHTPCTDARQLNYFVGGDTVINSFTYKKIFEKGQGYYFWNDTTPATSCPPAPYYYTSSTPSWFLRSAAKQVYLRKPGFADEYLLYDFNLSVGDTLPLTFNNYTTGVTVTAIDTVATANGPFRRFHLTHSNTTAQYLIEGVGSSFGLVEPMQSYECVTQLTCYSQGGSSYYPNTGDACDIAVGIKQNAVNAVNASVIPNPFLNEARVYFTNTLSNSRLTLVNVFGQKIILSDNFSGSNYIINRNNLTAGIYFLCVEQDNGISFAQKIVVAD